MNTQELLTAASDVMEDRYRGTRGCWQRGSAALTRLALEQILDEYWRKKEPCLVQCPTRHQLLALPTFAGPDAAELARTAWYQLCRAVHHHPYELAPEPTELKALHSDVTTLLTVLQENLAGTVERRRI